MLSPQPGGVRGELLAYGNADAYERYDYHRQKLVNLGAAVERHYRFNHLRVHTEECKHFSRLLLSGPHPDCIDFESPYPDKPEPMSLTVWCNPADASAWDDFIAKHDVPDYRQRFMPAK